MSGRAMIRIPLRSGRSKYARAGYARPAASMRRLTAARAVTSRLRAVRRPLIIKGSGAYSMSSMKSAQQVPYMHSTSNSFCIKHREFVGDVFGTQGFVNAKYRVNPRDPTTFPWLSTVGDAFEQYRFKGLAFEFVPTCGDALSSTNNALGTVIMAMNYNSADSPAGSKAQLLEQMWAVSGKPSEHKLMPVECARDQNPLSTLYTANSLPAGYDPRLYDLGFLQVATQGMQAAGVNVGELWVTYDVELIKPQNQGSGQGQVHISTDGINTTATNLQQLFAAGPSIVRSQSNCDVVFATNDIVLKAGKYQINIISTGQWNWANAPVFTGAVGIPAMRNQTQSSDYVNYVGSDGAITVFLNVVSDGGGVTLAPTAVGASYVDIYINRLPSTFA
jgi:hypothetical protein